MERTVGPCSPPVTSCRTTHTPEVGAQSQPGFALPSSAAVKGTGLHNNLSKSDNAAGEKGGEIPHVISSTQRWGIEPQVHQTSLIQRGCGCFTRSSQEQWSRRWS